jgi:hypothetical protein
VKFIFIYLFDIYTDFILGLSHGNPLLHPGGPLPPSSLEAIHNFARERELMALMLANNNRFDPMTLALANSFQVCIQLILYELIFDFRCHVLMIFLV